MNTELLKSKLLEAAFNGSLTHAARTTWKTATVGEVASFKYGYTDKARDNGTARFIRITDILPDGRLNPNDAKFVDMTEENRDFLLKRGSLLMARTGATFGKTLYFDECYTAIYASFLIQISLIAEIYPKFYWYFSQSPQYWNQANTLVNGGAQPQFNTGAISKVILSYPPIAEQQRIVATLEEGFAYIDAIASAKQNLSISANLLRSKILEDAFKGLLTSADVNKWEIAELGTACKHQNGDRGKNYPSKKKLSHCGIPFISALNLVNNTVIDDDKLLKMSEEQFNKLGNGKLQQGDFVLCIRGSVGKHGIYPFEKGAIASSLVILRPVPDKLSLMWLSYYFDSSLFRENLLEYINGTAQPNLAAKELMKFRIPLPPLAEQQRIVAKIEELFTQIDKITK